MPLASIAPLLRVTARDNAHGSSQAMASNRFATIHKVAVSAIRLTNLAAVS